MKKHKFYNLFGDAEDGALVEIEVALAVAPRVEHDPDDAHHLVCHSVRARSPRELNLARF